jgi:hypothetical protein
LLILDANPDFARSLAANLARHGHCVQRAVDESALPDAVIVGLPAPLGLMPEKLQDAPLLLLVDSVLPLRGLEAWIAGRSRWALLSRPLREGALERALERITRPAGQLPSRPGATPPPRA